MNTSALAATHESGQPYLRINLNLIYMESKSTQLGSDSRTPSRYTFPTLAHFVGYVNKIADARTLNGAKRRIWMGSHTHAGIHPFKWGSAECKEMSRVCFARAKQLGFSYNKVSGFVDPNASADE